MPTRIKETRLLVLDVLRGIFMFGIIVNHLGLYPNLFLTFTGRSRLWGSFAEGFFIISGFLLGFIHKDKWLTKTKVQAWKIFKRAVKIYFWSITLTLSFTLLGNLIPADLVKGSLWEIRLGNAGELVIKIFTLQYVYGWADFLAYYAIYLFAVPFFLSLVARIGVVIPLVISLLVWFWRDGNQYMALQLIFFVSLAVGFKFDWWQEKWKNLGNNWQSKVNRGMLVAFWITLPLSVISVFWFKNFLNLMSSWGLGVSWVAYLAHKNAVLNLYFDKRTLGVGRVFVSPIWFFAFLLGVERYKEVLKKVAGGIFYYFGTRSLNVYILHSIIIFPVPILLHYIKFSSWLTNTAATLGVLLIIYLINRRSKLLIA